MIVFSAIVPHSPLLLSTINKDQYKKVEKTIEGMKKLSENLYASKPDAIVILTSHDKIFDQAFSLNLDDHYQVDLSEFGDLVTKKQYLPDFMLVDHLQRALRGENVSLSLFSEDKLDYSVSIPLLLLTEKLTQVKIVPISHSKLTNKEHFHFGDLLKDVLMNEDKRIAVIASGDQSHALTSNSPAGFAKEGEEYDSLIQQSIVNKNTATLLQLENEFIDKAKECSYRQILMLLGLLDRLNYRPIIHSYEAPFGVGYLVVEFEMH